MYFFSLVNTSLKSLQETYKYEQETSEVPVIHVTSKKYSLRPSLKVLDLYLFGPSL
jgi:hypothetical protein